MKLVTNWRRVLTHAWSVRLNALTILLLLMQVADAVLPYLQDFIPEMPFRIATLLAAAGALYARFIPQRKVSDE